ncbi:MAG: histidinol dehydrogenase [Alphaproteobacteria bacterium]|nr:histidinol dehydrogenase [Alphaproteobacteria bacterium]
MRKLSASAKDFTSQLAALMACREEATKDVSAIVATIISHIRKEGDASLIRLTDQFDRHALSPETMRVSEREIANALSLCAPELMKSLKLASARIKSYSEKQMPADLDYVDESGTRLGHRWSAIDAVGLYVPGGTAAYPSSVLMNAIPAKVAGVKRLVMVVPCPEGVLNSAVLAAAHVAGVDEIYKIGGAQAVAALAFGTETIKPVYKIVGPGNAYVAEAKRQVFGTVGIDMIAGPSEILVLSDNKSNPAWVAADLLSQAEHDPLAQSILITDDARFAESVEAELEKMLKTLPRQNIARASWEHYGAIITVENWQQACDIANDIAPEHLELMTENAEELAKNIRHAGAIFIGRHTPEAVGDYIAGPSHVLPTSRTARFSSGLSVFDFLKRSSIISCTQESFEAVRPYGEVLAHTEGLGAHELSLSIRKP